MSTVPSHFTQKPHILNSTIAGTWYPGSAKKLDALIKGCLDAIPFSNAEPQTNVLILPHAGYAYSAQTAAYGIKRIQNNA